MPLIITCPACKKAKPESDFALIPMTVSDGLKKGNRNEQHAINHPIRPTRRTI